MGLYWKCLFKRHFLRFLYMVEIFEFWPSTIPKKWNYTKSVLWRDTFHNLKKKKGLHWKCLLKNFYTQWKILNLCWRDTFRKRKKKLYLLISITCYTTKCLKFITCIHYNQYFDIQSKPNESKPTINSTHFQNSNQWK